MQQFLSLKVIRIVRETASAVTLVLKPENGEDVIYKPGQFLTFILNIRGKEIRRSFSLSSSPGIDAELAVTLKRIPNGEISTYLYERIQVGDVLHALPPAGRFTLDTDEKNHRDIFLIAAGSGITPVFSLLQSVLIQEPGSSITLIYSNRNEKTTIFYDRLNELAQKYKEQFTCIYIFSEPDEKDYPYHAHLNLELLRGLVLKYRRHSPGKAEFMLCGPFGFMRMAEMMIVAMGFDKSQVHKENFVILAEQEAISRLPDQGSHDKTVYIHYGSQTYKLVIPPGKPILKAALEEGVHLPYSCQGGICGTCSAICSRGKIAMTINEVLTEKDLKNGWVLTCVGYPISDETELLFE